MSLAAIWLIRSAGRVVAAGRLVAESAGILMGEGAASSAEKELSWLKAVLSADEDPESLSLGMELSMLSGKLPLVAAVSLSWVWLAATFATLFGSSTAVLAKTPKKRHVSCR